MNNTELKQIKEYYIAYFDILGYSAIFEETPEKEFEFLNVIHTIFTKTEEFLETINQSPIVSTIGELQIQFRVFSDNIILCIEAGDDGSKEKARIITFMGIVSSLQRSIITECGMTIRGGLTKGRMSINEAYVFGKGLIEVVDMEKRALYPRIVVSSEIVSYLAGIHLFSQEDLEKAISIENRAKNLEEISAEDRSFYDKLLRMSNMELLELNLSRNLLYQHDDGVWSLSYLYCFNINSLIPKQTLTQAMEIIKQISPGDYERIPKDFLDMDAFLLHISALLSKS
jgi:hypothetical protein